jgi:hypothetical protein
LWGRGGRRGGWGGWRRCFRRGEGVRAFGRGALFRRVARGAAALQAAASSEARTPGFARGPRLAQAPDGPAKELAPFRGSNSFCLSTGSAGRYPSDACARRCGPVGARRPEGQRRRETRCACAGVRARGGSLPTPTFFGVRGFSCHRGLARRRPGAGIAECEDAPRPAAQTCSTRSSGSPRQSISYSSSRTGGRLKCQVTPPRIAPRRTSSSPMNAWKSCTV